MALAMGLIVSMPSAGQCLGVGEGGDLAREQGFEPAEDGLTGRVR